MGFETTCAVCMMCGDDVIIRVISDDVTFRVPLVLSTTQYITHSTHYGPRVYRPTHGWTVPASAEISTQLGLNITSAETFWTENLCADSDQCEKTECILCKNLG